MTRTGARRAVAELSVRGRAFLAAGLTAMLCAFLLGQRPLMAAGAFAGAVPLVSLLVMRCSRFDVHLRRRLRPERVAAGATTRVTLSLVSQGRVPRRQTLVEDRVPYVLGPRTRIVVHDLAPGHVTTLDYDVTAEVRGRYEIGPLRLHVRDPFGMVDLVREFSHTTALVVRPRISTLPRIHLDGGAGTSGEERPRAAALGSAEDATVREYRRGDDLRRVHWRTTARTGELMVRREEDPFQAHATVLIDNRASAHAGATVGSSFERAVEIAASICAHLASEGYTVTLVDADGVAAVSSPRTGGAAQTLDRLAVIGLTDRGDLTRWSDHSRAGERHVTAVVLGRQIDGDAAVMSTLTRRGTTRIAVVLDVELWRFSRDTGLPPQHRSERPSDTPRSVPGWFTRQGWRTSPVRPADAPATVWQRVAKGERT